jgi:hypothetical protein
LVEDEKYYHVKFTGGKAIFFCFQKDIAVGTWERTARHQEIQGKKDSDLVCTGTNQ